MKTTEMATPQMAIDHREFNAELKRQKFKEYRHKSGFCAWSKANLCEYSDEWEQI